ncbi:hypothetical protein Msil_0182 [Methylocella silvestris BL2]|uniref:Uncharacterized protein n=1 Tax=Methylocella silvestris (strain DSM 15510 / CIP 108128 / LMG 27833 / NCIMB 13906 / BL2) TaxID=395965 RepID=B8EN28_METSB|nr:hypothetical protein [Methylocella silvestris]ACK49163.1 hypothetical protein Msil_0182 [Methylocella silvestris BL2]
MESIEIFKKAIAAELKKSLTVDYMTSHGRPDVYRFSPAQLDNAGFSWLNGMPCA